MQWKCKDAVEYVWWSGSLWELKFAWLPVQDTEDGVWVWLEAYYLRYECGQDYIRRVPNGKD